MFFFDENAHTLRKGNEIGERLNKIAKEKGMLIMACDQCALRRDLAQGSFEECGSGNVSSKNMIDHNKWVVILRLYSALSGNIPNLVITL